MNEFERIGLEFDIALENSDSMMDMIYNVLSIEENNIYLKESSGEVDEEELDDMYTEAAGKFMEKARKLFDTIIEAIKKFFNQLSTAFKTKIRQSQINKKLDDIEKNLAGVKVKELKKKGHTADPRKLVVLYKQYTKEVVSVITKYCNDDNSNVEDLVRKLHAIESSDKYKDFSLEELDIIGTSIKENINFTKAELKNMDRLNVEILNTSVSAEEKLKEYAAKANNSDMVNAIHSAGSKIASAGKKVGKLASDHPLLTTVLLTGLYMEVQPHIIHGVEKISERRNDESQKEIDEKRKKLKNEAYYGIIKDRYGVDVTDYTNNNAKIISMVGKKEAGDRYKRRQKYLHTHDHVSTKTVPKGPINKDRINEAYKKNK